MANLNARMMQRVDSAASWSFNNPILFAGEIGVESDTQKIKVGDGLTTWVDLPYYAPQTNWDAPSEDPSSIINKPLLGTAAFRAASSFEAAGQGLVAAQGEVSNHENAAHPHQQYLTQAEGDAAYDVVGAAAAAQSAAETTALDALTAHEAAADPHSGYLTQAEADALYATTAQGDLAEGAPGRGELGAVAFTNDFNNLDNKPTLGTAAALNVGAGPNNVVQLTTEGILPALDASNLTNVPGTNLLSDLTDVEITNPQEDQVIRRVGGIWVNSVSPGGGGGTVSSVNLVPPTGLLATGGPITTSGNITLSYDSGYTGFTVAEQEKLASIEANAKDDLTGEEIRDLYEATADRNAFTDADKSKLVGIETNAKDDQTGGEIRDLYEALPDRNAFTDAEKNKLGTVEEKAQANIQTDWDASSGPSELLNKPTLGTAAGAAITDFATAAQGALASIAVQPTRTFSTGAGLAGGGDFSANRTISLSASSIASLAKADLSVPVDRQVIGGHGLFGGGDLTDDISLSVNFAEEIDALEGTEADEAMNPLRTRQMLDQRPPTPPRVFVDLNGGTLNVNADAHHGRVLWNYSPGTYNLSNLDAPNDREQGFWCYIVNEVDEDLTLDPGASGWLLQLNRNWQGTQGATLTIPGYTGVWVRQVGNFGGYYMVSFDGYRGIPVQSKSSAYTLTDTDNDTSISISSGGVTAPSGLFQGTAVTIFNNSGSNQTITQGAGLTMYWAQDGSTGNRTLAGRGECIIHYKSGSVATISGAGLS